MTAITGCAPLQTMSPQDCKNAAIANYVAANLQTVRWGQLPNRDDAPVLTVAAGSTVVMDTVSHEGILEDQGRDPVAFFAAHGVDGGEVLQDAVSIAAHGDHRPDLGPHIVTGPVQVEGAAVGDLLAVHIVSLQRRVDYGVISSRHHRGLLPDRFPTGATAASVFCPVSADRASLPLTVSADSPRVHFELRPFLGIMGVTSDDPARLHSTPPGLHGGNLDIALLVESTTLYLPVQVPGAGFYIGDPHFAQGNGEIALTALEAPLRATLRLDVIPATQARSQFGDVRGPFAKTADFWVPTGLDLDLDLAVAKCAENAIALLVSYYGMQPDLAYAYLSAACDFEISQVVDVVKGAHAMIRMADFAGVPGSACRR